MKTIIQIIALALLGLFVLPTSAFAQLYEVPLDDKIEHSTLIVEGKVIESQCYRADNGDLYTANKVELGSILKGDYREKFLTIITWGDELDGESQTWTHLLTLAKGDYGLFFLEPTRVPAIQAADFPESFDVYSGQQGFLALVQNEVKAWAAYEPFHTYTNIEADLYQYIARKTGETAKVVNVANAAARKTGIRYHFTDIVFDGTAITFKVYVNSLTDDKKLYRSGLQLNYNPNFFGANLATNGNLSLYGAGISASSAYSLTQSDISSSKVKIELSSVDSLTGLATIGTSEQLLAEGKLTIQNIAADPGITYDIAEMQSMSKFYKDGLVQVFDTVVVDGDWRVSGILSPNIVDFSPKIVAAGIKDAITITGTNFGVTRGSSRIQFHNAHQGENPVDWVSAVDSQYVFWSDTKIIVLVPSVAESGTSGTINEENYAGTGRIRIRTGVGLPWQIDESDSILIVRFCVNNIRSTATSNPPNKDFITEFSNRNSLGGYTLYYPKAFKNLAGSTGAFERALTNWRCATLVNFDIKDSATISNPASACRIDLIPLPVGVTTTLAQTSPSTPACVNIAPPNAIIGVGMSRFSISFNKNLSWHTSTTMPPSLPANTYDLESRAVHEIGHAHLLKHSNNHNDLMYFTDLTPPYRRNIEPYDLLGGIWVMNNSTDIVNTSGNNCKPEMMPITLVNCMITTNVLDIEDNKIKILVYPSIFQTNVNIELLENWMPDMEYEIIDITGKKIIDGRIESGVNTVPMNEYIPDGLYLLYITHKNNIIFTNKIIKQ